MNNEKNLYIPQIWIYRRKMGIISKENSFGAWMFLIGIILAIVIGVAASSFIPILKIRTYTVYIYSALILIGVVVGFSIRISNKDYQTFLITGAVIVIVSKFGMDTVTNSFIGIGIGETVGATFAALSILFIPATIIFALKTVFSLARV
jgi:hypothetical protein